SRPKPTPEGLNITRRRKRKNGNVEVTRNTPSVHIIVIDSIGASHGRRIFNRTHRFLKERFGAVEMLHMNKQGYVTMMAEDWIEGVVNWPKCKGFRKQPTTRYMRPFQLQFKDGETIKDHMSEANCFEQHLILNDYHEKFMKAYPDSIGPPISLTIRSLNHSTQTCNTRSSSRGTRRSSMTPSSSSWVIT
ncbi:hypothetical protein PENTCL1PPCAC_20895, partial [Pristionchus entomophagus]